MRKVSMEKNTIQDGPLVDRQQQSCRFELAYVYMPVERDASAGCSLCGAAVWHDGLVAHIRADDDTSVLPVCAACLERENPSFLDAMAVAQAAITLAATGGVSP